MNKSKVLFLVLSVLFVGLIGYAAWQDNNARSYISIQQTYINQYHAQGITTGVQQLFPTFSEASQGGSFAFPNYKTERCISCHVPDIATINPNTAAQRISQDFFKYDPNAKQLQKQYNLTGHHPAYINAQLCDTYGPSAYATSDGFHSYLGTATNSQGVAQLQAANLPGFLPSFLCDSLKPGQQLSIGEVGCIVCHNGNRLALTQSDAHQNLIINPEYSWSAGAAIYYEYCISCHGIQGGGGVGPPLNNQDRLGFYNEDYYYRCIEYGFTGFEHYGSVMPAWGSIASDFTYTPGRDQASMVDGGNFAKFKAHYTRKLSEQQIVLMTQFIRHWENYQTLP